MPYRDALDLAENMTQFPPYFMLAAAQAGFKPPDPDGADEMGPEDIRELRRAL